jgi:hypothetical protein
MKDRNWWWWLSLLSISTRCIVVKDLWELGRLTPWQLWDILSGNHSPIPRAEACQIYTELGFKPFAGYPLQEEARP